MAPGVLFSGRIRGVELKWVVMGLSKGTMRTWGKGLDDDDRCFALGSSCQTRCEAGLKSENEVHML